MVVEILNSRPDLIMSRSKLSETGQVTKDRGYPEAKMLAWRDTMFLHFLGWVSLFDKDTRIAPTGCSVSEVIKAAFSEDEL